MTKEVQLTVEMVPEGKPLRYFRFRADAVLAAPNLQEALRLISQYYDALRCGVEIESPYVEGSAKVECVPQSALGIVRERQKRKVE
ncbi:MAG: hypothetical protein JW880_05190 [Candidatus Thermoplasmatota archaeon]|nr:hypothetical protein [Candidatus Thermoplasmatota archaeon]